MILALNMAKWWNEHFIYRPLSHFQLNLLNCCLEDRILKPIFAFRHIKGATGATDVDCIFYNKYLVTGLCISYTKEALKDHSVYTI
jgi:hypothetical protein